MDQQQNRDQINQPPPPTPPANTNPESLNELRRRAAALHAAAGNAIQAALSTNSQAFNAAMRQEGGE